MYLSFLYIYLLTPYIYLFSCLTNYLSLLIFLLVFSYVKNHIQLLIDLSDLHFHLFTPYIYLFSCLPTYLSFCLFMGLDCLALKLSLFPSGDENCSLIHISLVPIIYSFICLSIHSSIFYSRVGVPSSPLLSSPLLFTLWAKIISSEDKEKRRENLSQFSFHKNTEEILPRFLSTEQNNI